jgi:hypothetical protein
VTNVQLYFAIGLPSVLALVNIGITLALFLHLGTRIQSIEDRLTRSIDNLTGAINDLDKRLTRVEIKLGIQP